MSRKLFHPCDREFRSEKGALINAIHRCHNPNHQAYRNYGARGITVYPEWQQLDGFELFLAHIGPKPSPDLTLDRIDNDLGYQPGNVRWASRRQQQMNRRKNLDRPFDYGWGTGHTKTRAKNGHTSRRASPLVPYQGQLLPVSEVARLSGVLATTIRQRLDRGLPPELATNPNLSFRGSRNSDWRWS